MERKLASIQKVLDVQLIPGADAIECLTILGWKVVAKKGEFKVGDLIVYFEVDSILKESPDVEFLRKSGFRIKTIRLRGQVSQGLCLPLSILPSSLQNIDHSEGTDVTELLGVVKWEPYVPAQLAGIIKGNFPEFLHKTDETRIQAVPAVLYRHQLKKFYVTEKVDGSSMTVYFRRNEHFIDGEFGVCSRNLDIFETVSNSFWKTARALDLEGKLRIHATEKNWLDLCSDNIALQGELIGPGVQGNKLKLSELHYFVFNIFDINTGRHLDFEAFRKLAAMLRLETVPLVNEDYILPTTVDELVEYSKGKSLLNKDVHREGVVLRPLINEYDEDLHGRLSFKCINPDFLIKYDSE